MPFEQKLKLANKAPCDPRKNCEAVGSLVKYAICTWPTICWVITKLSQLKSNPPQEHWTAVKRVTRGFWWHEPQEIFIKMLGKAEGLHLTQLISEQCNFMEMLFLRKCRAPLLYPKFHFDQVNIFDNTRVHYFNRSSRHLDNHFSKPQWRKEGFKVQFNAFSFPHHRSSSWTSSCDTCVPYLKANCSTTELNSASDAYISVLLIDVTSPTSLKISPDYLMLHFYSVRVK